MLYLSQSFLNLIIPLFFIICYPIVNDENEKIGFINGAVNLRKSPEISNGIDVYNGFFLDYEQRYGYILYFKR